MSEIRFYHLQNQTQDQALPALLAKALQNGHRIVVKTRDEKEAERLNEYLWVYNPNSFLPHGNKKDGEAAMQPVWLTNEEENPNEADVLILTEGSESGMLDGFKLCCEMLDGRNENAVKAARERRDIEGDVGQDQ